MAKLRRTLGLLLALACPVAVAAPPDLAGQTGQIAVIVSSREPAPELDAAALRDIYLKKIFLDDLGRAVIPVNLPPTAPLRQAFAAAAIHMDEGQLRNYWNRRYFHGVSPPYVLGSQTAVLRFVASTPGAIGYVSPCHLDAEVRVVLRLPGPPDQPGDCPP